MVVKRHHQDQDPPSWTRSTGEPLHLLPVEAEGGEFIHVAAVDLGQGLSPQRAALHQLLIPAGGAPGLQLLLDAPQDLLVMRCGDLSAVTPVHLQGEVQQRYSDSAHFHYHLI